MLSVITDIEIGNISHFENFREVSRKAATQSLQKDEGCQIFDIYSDPDNKCLFTFNEVYTDEAAYNYHLTSANHEQMMNCLKISEAKVLKTRKFKVEHLTERQISQQLLNVATAQFQTASQAENLNQSFSSQSDKIKNNRISEEIHTMQNDVEMNGPQYVYTNEFEFELGRKLETLIQTDPNFLQRHLAQNDLKSSEMQLCIDLNEFILKVLSQKFYSLTQLLTCQNTRQLVLDCKKIIETYSLQENIMEFQEPLQSQHKEYKIITGVDYQMSSDDKVEQSQEPGELEESKENEEFNDEDWDAIIMDENPVDYDFQRENDSVLPPPHNEKGKQNPVVKSHMQILEENFGRHEWLWVLIPQELQKQFQFALEANSSQSTIQLSKLPKSSAVNSIIGPGPSTFNNALKKNHGQRQEKSSETKDLIEFEQFLQLNQKNIEAQFNTYKKTKMNQSFHLSGTNKILYQGNFTGLDRAWFAKLDPESQVSFTVQRKLIIQVLVPFTFIKENIGYRSGNRLICEACVSNKKFLQIGTDKIYKLCNECRTNGETVQNLFIQRAECGIMYLVDQTKPDETISLPIQVQIEKTSTQFCLADEFVPEMNIEHSISEIGNSIEFQFVEYFFNNTIATNEKIIKVEKIKNRNVQSRFLNELKIIKEKNQDKPLTSLIKVLFHGTRTQNPVDIVTTETGLDMRYANKSGHYGAGIYFADNASYSNTYAYQNAESNTKQILLCFVIVGDPFIAGAPTTYKVPPNRTDGKQHDSVNGANGSHYIIYDNNKQYPCYLISYR